MIFSRFFLLLEALNVLLKAFNSNTFNWFIKVVCLLKASRRSSCSKDISVLLFLEDLIIIFLSLNQEPMPKFMQLILIDFVFQLIMTYFRLLCVPLTIILLLQQKSFLTQDRKLWSGTGHWNLDLPSYWLIDYWFSSKLMGWFNRFKIIFY